MAKREYICRCEEITKEEILDSIRAGDRTLEAVKKRTGCSMGYCQGKNCRKLLARLLAEETGQAVENLLPGSIRCPVGPVPLRVLKDVPLAEKQ